MIGGYIGFGWWSRVVWLVVWFISQLVDCMIVSFLWVLPGNLLLSLPGLLLHPPGVDPVDVGCVQVGVSGCRYPVLVLVVVLVGVGVGCW